MKYFNFKIRNIREVEIGQLNLQSEISLFLFSSSLLAVVSTQKEIFTTTEAGSDFKSRKMVFFWKG
jgi:hypothetical protein